MRERDKISRIEPTGSRPKDQTGRSCSSKCSFRKILNSRNAKQARNAKPNLKSFRYLTVKVNQFWLARSRFITLRSHDDGKSLLTLYTTPLWKGQNFCCFAAVGTPTCPRWYIKSYSPLCLALLAVLRALTSPTLSSGCSPDSSTTH